MLATFAPLAGSVLATCPSPFVRSAAMPPKLKRARGASAAGAAAADGNTDVPPVKRAKAGQQAAAAAQAHVADASSDLPSAGHASASASAAAASSSVLPSDAEDALKDFQRACKQTRVSVQLAAALSPQKPLWERLKAATELLLEDASRDGGPLIDLSHRIEGKGSLLMLVIETFEELMTSCRAGGEAEEGKMLTDAFGAALPYVSKLIRASYDTTIKRSDGKDALAMMVSSIILLGVETWPYDVVEALLDRSADVNTRFNGGLTPLIAWSFGVKPPMHPGCVIGPLLLLRRGADIDARMDDGTTCAHAIASEGNAHLAAALADGGWLAAADLTLLNNAGETALQVAQRELAFTFDDGDRQLIHDSLRDHAMLWTAKARPLIHRWLSHSLFIPDLAHMVLSFVDSKERGQ